MKKIFWKKLICIILVVVMFSSLFSFVSLYQSAQNTLSLTQAKTMALANSDSYSRIKSKISLKEVSYKQAVKSIQLKIKNKTTFRWSPLLSFKFPDKLNFEDESTMVYKPAQIQNDINNLKHDLADEVYAVNESVSQSFLKVYTYQELISFEEDQLEELKKTLEKNNGRLLLGLATKADVEAIEKDIESVEQKLSQDKKNFENEKEKLSDFIHVDVTSRYVFTDPYITAEIPREKLNDLVTYTLNNDQLYYEAKMATQLSLMQLDANYSLIKQQYGSKVNVISSFVQQVKSGQKIDSATFKLSYDKFLQVIDQPWQGKWKILFIKIPKEWLKGQIDGVRYIEDEPYALYENALEYQDALAEQKEIAKDLESQVRDTFESVVTARNSYLNLKKQVEDAQQQLQKDLILNTLGMLSFEEYTDSLSQYEELQMEELSALELYDSLLFSFDRLTCGAVSKYFTDTDNSLTGGTGGNSYIVDEESIEGAEYYIQSIVEDNMFELGIYLLDDFETDISHYELWVDGYQIGERTEITKNLRHLALTLEGEEKVFIRLYNEDTFVDDCEINPSAYQGPLNIKGYIVDKADKNEQKVIGEYEVIKKESIGIIEISMDIQSTEGVYFYTVQNKEGKNLLSQEKISIDIPFKYLDFLANDMDLLVIRCYDKNGNETYVAYFNPSKYEIYRMEK